MLRGVAVNEDGRRIGEDHPLAVLSDHEVELLRQMHEDDGMAVRALARIFEIGHRTARDIVSYRRRNHRVAKYKALTVQGATRMVCDKAAPVPAPFAVNPSP